MSLRWACESMECMDPYVVRKREEGTSAAAWGSSSNFRCIKNLSIHGALTGSQREIDRRVQRPLHLSIRHIRRFSGGAGSALRLISADQLPPPVRTGPQLGVLELMVLPSIDERHWGPMVQETDALLVGGGIPSSCATGYTSHDWHISSRHCATRFGSE